MSRRKIIIGAAALAILVPVIVFFVEPAPRTVLRKAQRQLIDEKTMRVEIEAALAMPPQDLGGVVVPSDESLDIALRTDVDRTAPLRPMSVSSFVFTQGTGDAAAKLSGEARRKDGRHYLKLEETGRLDTDVASKLKGAWVASDRPFLDFIAPPDERDLAERPLDAAGFAVMRQAFTNVDIFIVTEKKPIEKLGDAKARRYAVEVNAEAVSALLLKLRETRTGTPIVADDILAVTAEMLRWGKPVGEVWIDKRTGKFLKIGLISAVEAGESSGAVGGTVVFSRYGAPVEVDAPEAEDIEKVLGPLFTKRLSLADDRADDAPAAPAASALPSAPPAPGAAVQEADSDGDGLADGQEFFYGSDAWNPDTDGDGWNDGLEVAKGMDPVGPGALFSFGL